MHGEGDGLPSLVIDRYDRWLVVQFTSLGLAQRRDLLTIGGVALAGLLGLMAYAREIEAEQARLRDRRAHQPVHDRERRVGLHRRVAGVVVHVARAGDAVECLHIALNEANVGDTGLRNASRGRRHRFRIAFNTNQGITVHAGSVGVRILGNQDTLLVNTSGTVSTRRWA